MDAPRDSDDLERDNRRLHGAILRALEHHPESEPVVDDITRALVTDAGYRFGDSPEQTERKEIALLKRVRVSLQQCARALVARHSDVKGFFEGMLSEKR